MTESPPEHSSWVTVRPSVRSFECAPAELKALCHLCSLESSPGRELDDIRDGRRTLREEWESASGGARFLSPAPAIVVVQPLNRVRLSATRGLQNTRLPVHRQLPELAQTHVCCVGDAIQPSHPVLFPSPTFNLSQHQGLFQWVSSSPQVARELELHIQHQSFQQMLQSHGASSAVPASASGDSWRSSEAPYFRRVVIVRPGAHLLRGSWGWWPTRDGDPTPPACEVWGRAGRFQPPSAKWKWCALPRWQTGMWSPLWPGAGGSR